MFLALSLFVAATSGYKTWCLEINCDGTTWGVQSNVKVFDQTVLKNKDKRAHSIVCKGCPVEFKATLQPGGSFIFNSSLPGTFTFMEEGTTITGTIEISTLVPVGVKVIKVNTLGFIPPVLEIVPGDTVNVVLGENATGQLHGIRSEAAATVAEGFLIDRLLGGISFGTTDVLEGSKVFGAIRYFDPKYPQNKGVINIVVPPDNRPAEPDNVGCTSAPLCAAAGATPAPAVNNPPTAAVDCTRGCSNAVLGTSQGEKQAKLSLSDHDRSDAKVHVRVRNADSRSRSVRLRRHEMLCALLGEPRVQRVPPVRDGKVRHRHQSATMRRRLQLLAAAAHSSGSTRCCCCCSGGAGVCRLKNAVRLLWNAA
jgi:hypothetical protein